MGCVTRSTRACTDADRVLLDIAGLGVGFRTEAGAVQVLRDVSLALAQGQIMGIVGESGSGKSVLALSVLRLLGDQGFVTSGRIGFDGRDLLGLDPAAMRAVRGRDIAMVFQEPMSSLNPLLSVGFQIAEVLQTHLGLAGRAARARGIALLEEVGLPAAAARYDDRPHALSGGQRQRVMIAMAMACRPRLLIADEPTTALDVTIQAQILALMQALRRDQGAAILLITHDIGVIAQNADAVSVMYAGEVVETAATRDLLAQPGHPYSRRLLDAVPTVRRRQPRLPGDRGADALARRPRHRLPVSRALPHRRAALCRRGAAADGVGRRAGGALLAAGGAGGVSVPVLAVHGIGRDFAVAGRLLRAVDAVDLDVADGETLGIVGESGCGKTTLARMMLRLTPPSRGRIRLLGTDVTDLTPKQLRPHRRHLQAVFQDPMSSLNPRMTVRDIIAEPLRPLGASRADQRGRAAELLGLVGLPADAAARLPHAFSGGQRQRIAIARALAAAPRVVVCDEAISALDVSVQAQILSLLADLQDRLGLSLVFVSHNLGAVRHVSHRVAVMYLGRIVELGTEAAIFDRPAHPYTQALLAAVPDTRVDAPPAPPLMGEVPDPLDRPDGCHFHPRCARATSRCRSEAPPLAAFADRHHVRCFHPG